MTDKIPLETPLWNKNTFWFFGLGLLGWIFLSDAFLHFVPWPDISPLFRGDWPWWGWILVGVVGIPISLILSIVGFMMFAAFVSNFSAVTEFVPTRMAQHSVSSQGDREWNKIFQRWQMACFLWYLPWVLVTFSRVLSQHE